MKTQKLKEKLILFGLNPHDWHVIEDDKNVFKIQHLYDPELAFWGQAVLRNKKWDWTEIALSPEEQARIEPSAKAGP